MQNFDGALVPRTVGRSALGQTARTSSAKPLLENQRLNDRGAVINAC